MTPTNMATTASSSPEHVSLITTKDEARVDSRLLAKHLGNQHHSMFENVKNYVADFEALGKVRFETEASPGSKTGQSVKFVLLNEDQSFLLLTWQRLDRLKGFDEGAVETFRKGAYMANVPLQQPRTREDLYQKWREPGNKNASLTPCGGVGDAPIAPSGGVEGLALAPSHGAIDPVFDPLPTPPHGNHLEMPSTGSNPLSAYAHSMQA